jgi:hypothetical protein
MQKALARFNDRRAAVAACAESPPEHRKGVLNPSCFGAVGDSVFELIANRHAGV